MRYISFTILLCSILTIKSFSQTFTTLAKQNPDSLKTELSKEHADTTKVLIMLNLGRHYLEKDQKEADAYIGKALELSRKVKFLRGEINALLRQGELQMKQNKFDKAIALMEQAVVLNKKVVSHKKEKDAANLMLFNRLGGIYYALSDYDNALKNFKEALEVTKENNDLIVAATCMANIGVIYDEQGNYTQALKFYFKGLKFAEAHNQPANKVNNLINISTIYDQQNNTKLAIQYANQALELLNTKVNNDISKITCLGNLGDFYFKEKKYDKSLEYANQSLKLAQKVDDKLGLVYAYRAIGKVKIVEKKLQEALIDYNKALEISKAIGDKQATVTVEREVAYTYQKLKDFNKALKFAKNSLKDAEEIGSAQDIKDGYKALADIFESKGQTDSSYYYYKKFTLRKDQLFGEKNSRELNNIRANYDLEKKETEIVLLKKDRALTKAKAEAKVKRQRIIQYFFIAGFLAVFFIAFMLYRNNIQKQRANQLLQNKSDEIFQKNIQINAQNEAITSSINYAQRIQKAILPLEDHIASMVADYFLFNRPRDIVSGDFYWFIEHQNKCFFSVIDCTGHGVPGAFMSMLGNTALTNIVLQQGITEPHKILNQLSKEVDFLLQQHVTQNSDSMDVALCAVDLQKKELTYAGANNPMLCIQNGEMQVVKADRMPIGKEQVDMDRSYTLHTIDISTPTTVYLYTDGCQDQFGGPEGKKFKSSRLRELLFSNNHLSMNEQQQLIEKTMDDWMAIGSRAQVDDMLIMGVKLKSE
ncbi:hypothetical protein BKI52_12005 [marine bacterium AO1-C]|nr:hypothetical protein BKI52_12005 [marine bacterium AO1-C]